MNGLLKTFTGLAISSLALAAFGAVGTHATISHGRSNGYGLIVGHVLPCSAQRFDQSPSEPLIIILKKSQRTFVTYNVSADIGTTTYHFDVPSGRYGISTTWWGARDYGVRAQTGKTSRVNIHVSCSPFST